MEVLDGDVVRTHLSKGLGFLRPTVIRISADRMVPGPDQHGVYSIVAAVSPFPDGP